MVEPAKVIDEGGGRVTIEWTDGAKNTFTARQLRLACPCAGCVDEWTGEKMLKEESVADDLDFSHITVVGRYALNFHFSDGHETGIYSFNYLREVGRG